MLLKLAAVLKALPGRLFQVAGHTDNTGVADQNWSLSVQRALTVVRFLINKGALDGEWLSAGGYASYQPVATNDEKDGRAQNRRVEFLLVPNLEQLLKM